MSLDLHDLTERAAMLSQTATRIARGTSDLQPQLDWWRRQIPNLVDSCGSHGESWMSAAHTVSVTTAKIAQIGEFLKDLETFKGAPASVAGIQARCNRRLQTLANEFELAATFMVANAPPSWSTPSKKRRRR